MAVVVAGMRNIRRALVGAQERVVADSNIRILPWALELLRVFPPAKDFLAALLEENNGEICIHWPPKEWESLPARVSDSALLHMREVVIGKDGYPENHIIRVELEDSHENMWEGEPARVTESVFGGIAQDMILRGETAKRFVSWLSNARAEDGGLFTVVERLYQCGRYPPLHPVTLIATDCSLPDLGTIRLMVATNEGGLRKQLGQIG